MPRGNCYVTCEALWHLLGGKRSGWHPRRIAHEGDMHWFLRHDSGLVLDPTVQQFKTAPDYSNAIGCGFLTRKPSKRAQALMQILTWQKARQRGKGGEDGQAA